MIQDIKTIYQMIKPNSGINHTERIEHFYKSQAENYDRFRKKLLNGRRQMFQNTNKCQSDGVWVDFGAGTGASLDYLSDEQLRQYSKIYLVDISESLLAQAQEKIAQRDLKNVETVTSDIVNFKAPEFCDLVTFSYSLTMTPQWYKAIDHTYNILSPNGKIGVVDFYISEKYPLTGLKTHDPLTRSFWPSFFAYDNVFLNPDHLPYLINKFETVELFEGEGRLPVIPIGRVPYFSFIGKKS